MIPDRPQPVIEVEEEVYSFADPKNGSSPFWSMGSSCLVRHGDDVYLTANETLADAKPLNNTRWRLLRRGVHGWQELARSDGRTREPSPLGIWSDGTIVLSDSPTLTPPDTYEGPAALHLLRFAPGKNFQPEKLQPVWEGDATFFEHTYRNLAVDAERCEAIQFANVGYDYAHWSFLDGSGQWSACGRLHWPWGAEFEEPQAIRLCYGNVALHQRAAHIFAVSDIMEPNLAFRAAKHEITGRHWDYDFHQLYYSWTPDITTAPFAPWIKIADYSATGGHTNNCDLWLAPTGEVHLLWRASSVDVRLRERFFPDQVYRSSLVHTQLREGRVVAQQTLAEAGEDLPGDLPSWGRFHQDGAGRLWVLAAFRANTPAGWESPLVGNRLMQVAPEVAPGWTDVPARMPLMEYFFTNSERAGNQPANTLDVMGVNDADPCAVRYLRLRLPV